MICCGSLTSASYKRCCKHNTFSLSSYLYKFDKRFSGSKLPNGGGDVEDKGTESVGFVLSSSESDILKPKFPIALGEYEGLKKKTLTIEPDRLWIQFSFSD